MNRFVNFFKSLKLPKFARPSVGRIIFWVIAFLVAVGFFIFMRGFITCWELTSLDGAPPESCNSSTSVLPALVVNAKGTPLSSSVATAVPVPVVQAPTWDGGSRVNIVFFGLRGGQTSGEDCPLCTDTIILFSIDPVSKTAGMISIPRDLYVNIPGFQPGRINQAWTDGEISKLPGGGPGLAMKTVSQLMGVPIQYYAQVDFNTFVSFIDAIGGIDLRPYETLRLDPNGLGLSTNPKDKFILTKGGMRHLNGEIALAYARCRDQDQCGATGGDLDRSKRQQQVIIAIRNKVLNPANFPTLIAQAPAFYNTFGAGIHTNMSLDDGIKLAYLMKDIPFKSIKSVVFGNNDLVSANTVLGGAPASVYKPIPDKLRILRDEIFSTGGPVSPMAQGDSIALMQSDNAKIRVLNGTYTTGLDTRSANFFNQRGLKVIQIGSAGQLYSQTEIIVYSPKLYALRYIIALFNSLGIPINGNQIYFKSDPTSTADLEIRLGSDWIPKLPTGF
jgi:LCP family protein required for cell wall assembly